MCTMNFNVITYKNSRKIKNTTQKLGNLCTNTHIFCASDVVTLGVHAGEGALVVVKLDVVGYGGRTGSEAPEVRVQ